VWHNSVALRPGSDLRDNWLPEEAVDTHQACDAVVSAKNASEGRARVSFANSSSDSPGGNRAKSVIPAAGWAIGTIRPPAAGGLGDSRQMSEGAAGCA
jgi:hypothetical protein